MIIYKSKDEIAKMRVSGRITAQILSEMVSMVKPGVRPIDLDAHAEKRCRELGVIASFKGYGGFPANVCISVNDQIVHGIPNKRPFRDGDVVKVDFGVCANNYHGDSAVTIGVGEISQTHQRLIETTKHALDLVVKILKSGICLGDVSEAIQQCIEGAGFSTPQQFCGHGIGRKLHEDPNCANVGKKGLGPILREGIVLAWEPIANAGGAQAKILSDNWTAVTADGSYSAHFEHTIALTDRGPEILTTFNN